MISGEGRWAEPKGAARQCCSMTIGCRVRHVLTLLWVVLADKRTHITSHSALLTACVCLLAVAVPATQLCATQVGQTGFTLLSSSSSINHTASQRNYRLTAIPIYIFLFYTVYYLHFPLVVRHSGKCVCSLHFSHSLRNPFFHFLRELLDFHTSRRLCHGSHWYASHCRCEGD